MACCGYLTTNQKVLIYATHIKKVIVGTLFHYTEKQNNWQAIIGQEFSLELTPAIWRLVQKYGQMPHRDSALPAYVLKRPSLSRGVLTGSPFFQHIYI